MCDRRLQDGQDWKRHARFLMGGENCLTFAQIVLRLTLPEVAFKPTIGHGLYSFIQMSAGEDHAFYWSTADGCHSSTYC